MSFAVAKDGVDPAKVPTRKLGTGARMPAIGLGTFGSDRFSGEAIAEAVLGAASVGYRHFDCAAVYGNEMLIGRSLREIVRGGVRREELWVTSKLWNDRHGAVEAACEQSLRDLGLEYLDLYLVHWPFPNYHAPGVSVHSRDANASPYVHESYLRTWRQMEKLVKRGLVRAIGTSNMTVPKLRLLLRDAEIAPSCNEMELHPHFQQPELYRFVTAHGMVPIGFCPIGSPTRPDRDRTPEDTVDIDDPAIVDIARRHGVHPAVVCVAWAVQRGQVPIPFSVHRNEYLANIRACTELVLSPTEMREIELIDRGCRLIKGQVFLWKDGQSWEDLWDPTGEITPP